MNKWTPGKWSVDGSAGYKNLIQIPLRAIDCERIGFQIGFVNGHKEDEARANAHLISSAPDLYEALEMLAAEEWRDDDDPILGKARAKARAALAKARGEA